VIIAVPSDPRKRTPQMDAKKERKRRKYRGMLGILPILFFYFIFQKGTCTRLLTESQVKGLAGFSIIQSTTNRMKPGEKEVNTLLRLFI